MEDLTNNQNEGLPKKITKQDFNEQEASTKGKIAYHVRTACYLLLSAFLVSFAAYALITPNDFTIGGVAGIAILVNIITPIPQSILIFAINAPLIILSFFFI